MHPLSRASEEDSNFGLLAQILGTASSDMSSEAVSARLESILQQWPTKFEGETIAEGSVRTVEK